jgi:hypothetical protein
LQTRVQYAHERAWKPDPKNWTSWSSVTTAILLDTGAVISAKPFYAGSYRERTAFIHDLRRDGLDLYYASETRWPSAPFLAASPKHALRPNLRVKVLSCRDDVPSFARNDSVAHRCDQAVTKSCGAETGRRYCGFSLTVP